MYPEDSVQDIIGEWWIEDPAFGYHRGKLIRAFLPHVDQIPYQLIPTGRPDPCDCT
jgi:hypothetical protein